MNSNRNPLIGELHKVCDEINAAEEAYRPDVESSYETLLALLSRNPNERKVFSADLINNVNAYRNARLGGNAFLSVDALAFCMHVLRWQEVRDAVVHEHFDYFSPRRNQLLQRLIESFEDNWSQAGDYRHFAYELRKAPGENSGE